MGIEVGFVPIVRVLIIHDLDEPPFHQDFQSVVDRGQTDARVFLLGFLENLPCAGMGVGRGEDLQNRLTLLGDSKTGVLKRFRHFSFFSSDLNSPWIGMIKIRTILNKFVKENMKL